MTKRLYIDTVGCQMNVLDSEMVLADLRKRGFELAGDLGAYVNAGALATRHADAIAQSLLRNLTGWRGVSGFDDDVTFVVARVLDERSIAHPQRGSRPSTAS